MCPLVPRGAAAEQSAVRASGEGGVELEVGSIVRGEGWTDTRLKSHVLMPCVSSLGSSAHGYEKLWREREAEEEEEALPLSPLAVGAFSASLNENSVPRDAAPQNKGSAEGKLLRICRAGGGIVGRRWNQEIKEMPGWGDITIPCDTPPNQRSWLAASDPRVELPPSPSKPPAAPRRLTARSSARRCHLGPRSCNERVRGGRGLATTGINSKTASFTSLSSQAAQTLCPPPARLHLRHN